MTRNVVVLGSINIDIMVTVDKLPRPGETVDASSVNMSCGGRGANQSVQCAMLDIPTTLIGAVGTDFQGDMALESISSKKVDTTYVSILKDYSTGTAPIFVDPQGDNMLAYVPGCNKQLTKDMIDKASDNIKKANIYLTQTEINMDAMTYGLRLAKLGNATTILNPAPAVPLSDEVFSLVDIITPNETECENYTGYFRKDYDMEEWLLKVTGWFLDKGIKGVCITLGSNGSYFNDGEQSYYAEGFTIKPVDTTGAGDAFHGGFIYGLINNYDVETALKFGNACGALTSLTLGVQNAIPSKEEMENFINKNNVVL